MALWTFRAEVVPSESLGDGRQLTEAEFEDLYPLFWAKRDGEEAAHDLSALLPSLKPWDRRLTLNGVAGGDRIEVWRDAGRVTNVTLKVDCRTPNTAFVDSVEAIGVRHSLLFIYDRTFQVCAPKAGALRSFVFSSASRRALKNPETWLPYLAAQVRKSVK